MMILHLEHHYMAKVEVEGDHIQMEMCGLPVHMQMDRYLTAAYINILLELRHFVSEDEAHT